MASKADIHSSLVSKIKRKSKAFTPLQWLSTLENFLAHSARSKEDKWKDHFIGGTKDELLSVYNSESLQDLDAYAKLQKIHHVAPPPIPFDLSKPLKTLFRFSGSGLELVFHRPDFWLFLFLHIVLSTVYYGLGYTSSKGMPTAPYWPRINSLEVAIPGALMTFVLVFFLNQTFSRLISQSQRVHTSCGLLGELVLLLRVHLGDNVFPSAHVVRHLLCNLTNALHFLAYANLAPNREFNIDEWAWWFLVDRKLLTANQVIQLRPLQKVGNGSLVYKEVLLWVSRGIWAQKSKGYIDSRVASIFQYKIWEIRGNLDALFGFVSGPVPFAYYHLLNFVLSSYLILLAYTMVFVAPYWSIPGYILILIGLIGIRELGNCMSNPLGCDKTDIPVFIYAWTFLGESTLLIDRPLTYPDENVELIPAVKSTFHESTPQSTPRASTPRASTPRASTPQASTSRASTSQHVHHSGRDMY